MSPTFRLSVSDRIGTLTIDCDGEKINKLSSPVMQELRETLSELKQNKDIDALLISSAKTDIFIAGADIAEIKDITDPSDGFQKAQNGQAVFNLLEALPFPTIAVIDGACLGGGTEFALACTYRIVSDNPKTQMGLPEVSLGILPGFGGTQRLPRLIGLQQALGMILPGKAVDGKKAFKIHLADAFYDQAFLMDKSLAFAKAIISSSEAKKIQSARKATGLINQILNHSWIGQFIVFSKSKSELLKTTKGHYPAPVAALEVIKATQKTSLIRGLELEAKAFSELVITPTCKNLIQLFYTQESLKKYTGTATPNKVNQAGVLGAGLMGGGISWLFAGSGIPVRMKDLNWDALTKGIESADKINQKLIQIRKLQPFEANLNLHRISPTTHYSGFQQLDVVVEAVVENIEIKKSVFKELETHIGPSTVIASNTSALDVTEMASVLKQPDRFVGMHFFSPVNRMPLVEVIAGAQTSNETIATIVELAKRCKKVPIVVQNCPGFLVNRILIPYVNEAVMLLQDGADISAVDQEMVAFGMPLGPLALADEVGLDVGYKVAKILEDGYGERMKTAAAFHVIHSDKSLLGKKSQKGFYTYSKNTKFENIALANVCRQFSSDTKPLATADIVDRLILIMVNEAARCIEEKIVASPEYLDMAMIMGTGFPPFRGGLCRYADQVGIDTVIARLKSLRDTFGFRFEPAPYLLELAKSNASFYSISKS